MQEFFISCNQKKLFYKSAGVGPIVLLIHGFGETSYVWERMAVELSKNFRVVVPDLPGSGNSEMLEVQDNGDVIQIKDYAAAMKCIVDVELGISNAEKPATVSLVGHSFGGYIALAFLEQFSNLVDKLSLFHSSAFDDNEYKKEMRKKAIAFIQKNGSGVFLRSSIPDLFSERSKGVFINEINDLIEKGQLFEEDVLIQYYTAMMQRKDQSELLKKTDHPILFIIGEEDKAVPLEVSLKQCHLPSVSHITILKNVGHMGMIEDFNTSLNSLNAFLRSA